jgi:aspartokinase
MLPSIRLGGFKLLQEVVWLSVAMPERDRSFPRELTGLLAGEKTNLPFLTCGNDDWEWGLNIVIDSNDAEKTARLIENRFHKAFSSSSTGVILSIFPHHQRPEALGALLDAFGKDGVDPVGIANSQSSISVILRDEVINKATSALFGPFSFSAYRSPADWRLAQKGKEMLYKEVVASYQEKRPKVYGLEWEGGQDLLQVKMNKGNLRAIGDVFRRLSQLDFHLSFLITSPSKEEGETNLFFCVPRSEGSGFSEIVGKMPEGSVAARTSSVACFSMNGPHFGDRYGIANELLASLDSSQVQVLGLSCSIASISGVVPADQIHSAIHAIQRCFEVPSVINKTRPQ